jgi:LysM repeat protein
MSAVAVSPRRDLTGLEGVRPAASSPARLRVSTRRRRVLAALVTAGIGTVALGFVPGLQGAWWATAGIAVVAAAYVALLAHVRALAGRREWDLATADPVDGWRWEEWEVRLSEDDAGTELAASPTGTATLGRWALARFAASYAVGWLLTPVVVIAEQIAGGARADSRRRLWLEQLLRLQAYGRQQSVKALSLSIVASAGVTSLGAFASSASAAGLPSAGIAAAADTHYTVRAGDTLASIAARFGTTYQALAAANGISNPNLIYVGQVLVIASAPASGGAGSSGSTYTVRAGDTLASIAARFGTSYQTLASINGISNPNLIYVGQVLRLSGSAAPDPAPAPAHPSSGDTYTVEAGDTLASIAARFATTYQTLASINGISNPNFIYVGEVLRLSGSAPAQAPAPAPDPAPAPASSAQATAVRVALAQVGKPYAWGGAGPDSFDCSGLVMYAYAAAGISLPHYTVSQYDDTTRISESQLEPGDLVFYDTGGGAQPGHVAMYIGNGDVVSANNYGTYVQTQPLSWDGTIMGYGRVG